MSNGFPIHAYGTGQIRSAISDWRDRERQREDEMIKILTNQIATGNVAAITPDVRAKLNKRGISDPMISGLQKQGQQYQAALTFDKQIKAYSAANIMFGNILKVVDIVGIEKSKEYVAKALDRINELTGEDYSGFATAALAYDTFKKNAFGKVKNSLETLTVDSPPKQFALVRTAIIELMDVDKKNATVYKEWLDTVEKMLEEKEKGKRAKEVSKRFGKPSDFERAYQQQIKQPGQEEMTRAEFRKQGWLKESTAGELTDNVVSERIAELGGFTDIEKISRLTQKYIEYKKQGMSREEAFAKVQEDAAREQIVGETSEGEKSFRHLWD